MDLSQLEQIVAVADKGTISAAAEATHVSQPTLSRSMRQLETELDCGLFERTRNRARLNDAGRVVVEHARAILAERQRMADGLDELARRLRTLRVASVAPAASWRLASALVAADPAVIVEPELVAELEAERRLLEGTCDLALTLHPVHVPGVRSAPLCTESLSVAVPMGHPLASRSSVSFADIDGLPFLVYEQIGFWMGVVERNLPSSQVIVLSDRFVFEQLLGNSQLCAFSTDIAVNDPDRTGRVAVPIVDADAHVTYFANVLGDAGKRALSAFDVVASQS